MIYTNKVETKVVKDLSVMIGKMDEFKKLLNNSVESIRGEVGPFSDDELAFAYESGGIGCIYSQYIDVNSENISAEDAYITEISGKESEMLGFYEVNGFPVFGFNLGGDWESPVYATYVSDGTDIFCYIPLKGNSYNPKYFAAFGNNDDDEDDVECDFELIKKDILTAFCIETSKTTVTTDVVAQLDENLEELISDIEDMSDEVVGTILRTGLKELIDEFSKTFNDTLKKAEDDLSTISKKMKDLEAENIKLKDEADKVKNLEKEVKDLSDELDKYKTGVISTSSAEADAFKEIAKIVTAVSGGMSIPTSIPVAKTVEAEPTKPTKPLKKISLPTKTIKFEYVYGVEMDGSTAILHIIKKDDWARDELAKEGRVDVDTITRLKAEVPFKRDKFIYILNNPYDTVEDVVADVSKVTGINLVHSADVQAKF